MALSRCDDGPTTVDKVQSNIVKLILHYAEPDQAVGVGIFGPGLLVLPLLSRFDERPFAEIAGMWSYASHVGGRPDSPQPVLGIGELVRRFGLLDVASLKREFLMTGKEIEEYVQECGYDTTDAEISKIQKWRPGANANVQLLQRRAALAFLGLSPEATEVDVSKTYKKKALEVHPDKGGDSAKFQELLEKRDQILESPIHEEADSAANRASDDEQKAKNLSPKEEVRRLRAELHGSILRVYERARKTKSELSSSVSMERGAEQALGLLDAFARGFAHKNIADAPSIVKEEEGEGESAGVNLREFVAQGAELLSAAALFDTGTTRALLIARLGERAMASVAGAALLRAVEEVPIHVKAFLDELEVEVAQNIQNAKGPDESHLTKQHPRRKFQARNFLRKNSVPSGAVASQPSFHSTLAARVTSEEDPDLPVFEPPPIQCGSYVLRLRMVESSNGTEKVFGALWDGKEQVGWLQGTYFLRKRDANFHEACFSAVADGAPPWIWDMAWTSRGSNSGHMFDTRGRPLHPLKGKVLLKAHTAGLFCLHDVRLLDRTRGRDVGLDLLEAVIRCLSGALKRLTLAVCKIEPGDGADALERHWARIGYKRVSADQNFWYLEPGSQKRRLPKTPPAKRPRLSTPPPPFSETSESLHNVGPQKRADVITQRKAPRGVLTPRTRFALICAAKHGAAMLRADADQFVNGKPGGAYWGCQCLPPHLRSGVFKAFVKGMAEIVDVICALLREPRLEPEVENEFEQLEAATSKNEFEQLPTSEAVLRVLSPFEDTQREELGLQLNRHFVSHFFGKGGRVEAVIEAVIEEATAFYETQEECGTRQDETRSADYHHLPMKMLDGDFDYLKPFLMVSSAGG